MTLQNLQTVQSVVFMGDFDPEPTRISARKIEFEGELFFISDRRRTQDVGPYFESLEELPRIPEVAIVQANPDTALETLSALRQLGAKQIFVTPKAVEVAGGIQDDNSADRFFLREDGMGALGANERSLCFQNRDLTLENESAGIAIVSDCPIYLSKVCASERHLPIRESYYVGCEAVLDIPDIIESLLHDPRLKAIHLYFDSIGDIVKFSRAARKAARQGVPIIVTLGSMAGWDNISAGGDTTIAESESGHIIDTLFQRLGLVSCRSLDEAIELLKLFVYSKRPIGPNCTVVAESKAHAAMATNALVHTGLNLTPFSPSLSEELRSLMPNQANVANPLIISSKSRIESDVLKKVLSSFLNYQAEIAILVLDYPRDEGDDQESWHLIVETWAKEAAKQDIPAIYIELLSETLPYSARQKLIELGIVPVCGLEMGCGAIFKSYRYLDQAIRLAQEPSAAIEMPSPVDIKKYVQMDEAQGKRILTQIGIDVPRSVIIEGNSIQDISNLRYPVAVKALSAEIVHKTEAKAMRVNVQDEEGVRQSMFDILEWIESIQPTGFLIEEMIEDGVAELIVGVRHIPGIGQALTIGFGGLAVSLLQDYATLLLPTSSYEIERTLRNLRMFPLLEGYRQTIPAEIDLIVETISTIATYAYAQRQALYALEINPLIVRPGSAPPVAVDVVVQLGELIGEANFPSTDNIFEPIQ